MEKPWKKWVTVKPHGIPRCRLQGHVLNMQNVGRNLNEYDLMKAHAHSGDQVEKNVLKEDVIKHLSIREG